jgi:hypothetical protein
VKKRIVFILLLVLGLFLMEISVATFFVREDRGYDCQYFSYLQPWGSDFFVHKESNVHQESSFLKMPGGVCGTSREPIIIHYWLTDLTVLYWLVFLLCLGLKKTKKL